MAKFDLTYWIQNFTHHGELLTYELQAVINVGAGAFNDTNLNFSLTGRNTGPTVFTKGWSQKQIVFGLHSFIYVFLFSIVIKYTYYT